IYSNVESQSFKLKKDYQTGDILGVLSADIEKLQDFYIKTAFPSILGLVIYTIFVIVIGAFDLVFIILMMLVLGVILFLMPYLSYKNNKTTFTTLTHKRSNMFLILNIGVFGHYYYLE